MKESGFVTPTRVLFASVTALAVLFALGAASVMSEAAERPHVSETSAAANSLSESAPIISSFGVEGLAVGRLSDDQQSSNWCTPLNVGRFVWSIEGGAHPLELTVAGHSVDATSGSVEIPCHQLRAENLSGPQDNHVLREVMAHVVDANGLTGAASTYVIFVSDAPKQLIEGVRVFAGMHDAFFDIEPSPYRNAGLQPIEQLATVRYRRLGADDWTYLIPLPGPPQNCCGYWCVSSHVQELERNTDYEYQAAWMWHPIPWQQQRVSPLDANWWRTWTTAESLRWTESQRFRTYGEEPLLVQAVDDTITVLWPNSAGVVHTWLTSPDWPGVIWIDPANTHRWPTLTVSHDEKWSRAVFRGLPPDTTFHVTFKRALPDSFEQTSAQVAEARTPSQSEGGTAGVFDPGTVEINVGLGTLNVDWIGQSQQWKMETFLLVNQDRRHQESERYQDYDNSSALPSGLVSLQRQGARFRYVDNRNDNVLYLSLRPSGGLANEFRYPFVCLAWRIESLAEGPDSYLDRYFYSSPRHRLERVTPIASYEITGNGAWPYSPCRLGDPMGP